MTVDLQIKVLKSGKVFCKMRQEGPDHTSPDLSEIDMYKAKNTLKQAGTSLGNFDTCDQMAGA
jgi:hypothetical protein